MPESSIITGGPGKRDVSRRARKKGIRPGRGRQGGVVRWFFLERFLLLERFLWWVGRIEVVRQVGHLPLDDLCDQVLERLFLPDAQDDVAVLALRIVPRA